MSLARRALGTDERWEDWSSGEAYKMGHVRPGREDWRPLLYWRWPAAGPGSSLLGLGAAGREAKGKRHSFKVQDIH